MPPDAHLTKKDVTGRIIELLSSVEHLAGLSLNGDYCSTSLDTVPKICPHLVSLYLHGSASYVPGDQKKYTVQEICVLVGSLSDLELLSLDSNIEVASRQICETDLSDPDHEFLNALAAAPKLRHIVLYVNTRGDLSHVRPGLGIPYDTIKNFQTAFARKIFEYLHSVKLGSPSNRLDLDSG